MKTVKLSTEYEIQVIADVSFSLMKVDNTVWREIDDDKSEAVMLSEIVTMRKLLIDIGDSMYAEWPGDALHDAVENVRDYLEGLPKG